jgi:3,4-dihydroxyphthalate decarboxylase
VLLCGKAGVELRPVIGAYDTVALALALEGEGIPSYPRSVLISTPELAGELLDAMGDHSVCVMRGHGITVTGASVEEATIRAISLENLARVCWQLSSRGPLEEISAEDAAAFASRGSGQVISRGTEWVWRSYVRLLDHLPPQG